MINHEKETYDNLKKYLSSKFIFRNFDIKAHKTYIDNIDDVVEHIKDNEEKQNITFITNTDLTNILFQMVDKTYMPYTPYAKFENGILSRLLFKMKCAETDEKPILYSIQHGDSSLIYDEIMTV